MSRSNIMIWLSKREEKKVLNQCKNHLNKTVDTVNAMAKVVHSFCDEDFNALEDFYMQTFNSEREADEIKRQILQDVSKGPLHPIDREEIIRLVLTADDIAENAKSAARKLRITSKEDLPEELTLNLKEMANRCLEIVIKVERLLKR